MQVPICWAISNIATGTEKQVQSLIDHHVIPLLLQILQTGSENTRKEIWFALVHACEKATPEQILYFWQQGCALHILDAMCTTKDALLVTRALHSMDHIMQHICKALCFETMVPDAQVMDRLSALSAHNNVQLAEASKRWCEMYKLI